MDRSRTIRETERGKTQITRVIYLEIEIKTEDGKTMKNKEKEKNVKLYK